MGMRMIAASAGLRGRFGGWVFAFALVGSAGGNGSAAFAGDSPPEPPAAPAEAGTPDAAALDAQLRQHVKDKAFDAVRADAVAIGKAYAAVDAKGQKLLGAALSFAARSVQEEPVRKAVIEAVGETKDKALSGVLRPFLAQPDKRVLPPLLKPALEAAGKLADEELVTPLMTIVKDSKHTEAAALALRAFAGYGASKKARNGIVRDLIGTVSKDQPGVGKRWEKDGDSGPYETARTRTGEETQTRYQALSAALVPTLNAMTGQNCGSAEDWFALFERYKSSPGDLFAR
jgi:HEAT repeat protein